MQIKIEIDLKPEELRRFLGIPDMTGLPDEVISFLRDKLATAGETFDPATFVKDNLDQIKRSRTLRRILYGVEGAPRGKRRGGRQAPPNHDPGKPED